MAPETSTESIPVPVHWGILATGRIAGDFARDLALLPDAEIVAVGSRSQESADTFADEFGVAHRHASYDALVQDPDVDVIYVATPHPGHHDAALSAIEAGKAVLVEKPFTMDAGEASDLIAAARARGTFLMEAMWSRFLPHFARVCEIVASGTLGNIVTVTAEHGQWMERDPESRLFKRELGGGALLDLGIYPVSFASMVLGTPAAVTAVSTPAFTGVDATTSAILQYAGGAQALLTTTSYAACQNAASVNGSEARIDIAGTFYSPSTLRVTSHDKQLIDSYDTKIEGHGLRYQAAEVARCLRAGLTESPLLPLDETLAIMRTMDEIRAQIGLSYS